MAGRAARIVFGLSLLNSVAWAGVIARYPYSNSTTTDVPLINTIIPSSSSASIFEPLPTATSSSELTVAPTANDYISASNNNTIVRFTRTGDSNTTPLSTSSTGRPTGSSKPKQHAEESVSSGFSLATPSVSSSDQPAADIRTEQDPAPASDAGHRPHIEMSLTAGFADAVTQTRDGRGEAAQTADAGVGGAHQGISSAVDVASSGQAEVDIGGGKTIEISPGDSVVVVGDGGSETVFEIQPPSNDASNPVLVAIIDGSTSTVSTLSNIQVSQATPPSNNILSPAVISLNNAAITATPAAELIISGTTLAPGSPITLPLAQETAGSLGINISPPNAAGQQVLTVGSQTTTLNPLPLGIASSVLVINQQTITLTPATALLINGHIITPQSLLTIGSEILTASVNDAGSTVLILGGKTTTLPANIFPATQQGGRNNLLPIITIGTAATAKLTFTPTSTVILPAATSSTSASIIPYYPITVLSPTPNLSVGGQPITIPPLSATVGDSTVLSLSRDGAGATILIEAFGGSVTVYSTLVRGSTTATGIVKPLATGGSGSGSEGAAAATGKGESGASSRGVGCDGSAVGLLLVSLVVAIANVFAVVW